MVSIINFVNYFHVVQYAWALVKSVIALILLVSLKNYKMACRYSPSSSGKLRC